LQKYYTQTSGCCQGKSRLNRREIRRSGRRRLGRKAEIEIHLKADNNSAKMPYINNNEDTISPGEMRIGAGAGVRTRECWKLTMDTVTAGRKIRVLIADDVPCMRESLRTVLSLDPSLEIVGEAGDGSEAVKLAAHLKPDVVLVDLEMPCCDGYIATQELTERNLCSAVVVLSIHSDPDNRARARAAGASVFLPKGTPIGPLVSAIQRAAGRDLPPPSARFARLRAPRAAYASL
jgi:CheY-like chemotaxis protein